MGYSDCGMANSGSMSEINQDYNRSILNKRQGGEWAEITLKELGNVPQ